METITTGQVIVPVRLENIYDLHEVRTGGRAPATVRFVDVPDAVVDTGASTLCLPRRLVVLLGLKPLRTRTARIAGGLATLQIYGTVRLTVQGRECTCDVVELPDDSPVLIGQIPLELVDFVVGAGANASSATPPTAASR